MRERGSAQVPSRFRRRVVIWCIASEAPREPRPQVGSEIDLHYLLQYLLRDILDRLRSDDRHPIPLVRQGKIRRAAAVEKIERVFGFSGASLNGIRV